MTPQRRFATAVPAIFSLSSIALGCTDTEVHLESDEPPALAALRAEGEGIAAAEGFRFEPEGEDTHVLVRAASNVKKGTFKCNGCDGGCRVVDISTDPGRPVLTCSGGCQAGCKHVFTPTEALPDTSTGDVDPHLFEGLTLRRGQLHGANGFDWASDPDDPDRVTLRRRADDKLGVSVECACALEASSGGCNLVHRDRVVFCNAGDCGVLCPTEIDWARPGRFVLGTRCTDAVALRSP